LSLWKKTQVINFLAVRVNSYCFLQSKLTDEQPYNMSGASKTPELRQLICARGSETTSFFVRSTWKLGNIKLYFLRSKIYVTDFRLS
jgi:hypothetical protein